MTAPSAPLSAPVAPTASETAARETEAPRYRPPGQATLSEAQRALLRRVYEAERRVYQVYPAPVAAALADALRAFIDFGLRFETGGKVNALVDVILAAPVVAS